MAEILLSGATLTPGEVAQIAHGAMVALDPAALQRMAHTARIHAANGSPAIVHEKWALLTHAPAPDLSEAEAVRGFILGHCAAVGPALPVAVVRATMAARCNVLLTGFSACRPEIAEVIAAWLNADAIPVVPSQGSVGAAGDLAPLAHIARVLCGFGGDVVQRGERVPSGAVDSALPRAKPNQKEALSLINGATLTAAMAALVVHRSRRLLRTAEAAAALSYEVVRADLHCLSVPALEARRHPGAVEVAGRIRARLVGSEICSEGRIPDPFSVRCLPAVLGAAHDAIEATAEIVARELNGAADNPLMIGEALIEGGNFHGAPVALAMDHCKIALTQVASIAERRIFRMTYGQLSGLPSFLLPGTGLNNGLMLAQYTAASLVSECKTWSHPASVDSLPTVQHHEDHVSMGPIAARGALHIADALADVLAIELLCGAQGLDFHLAGESVDASGALVTGAPLSAGVGSKATFDAVRARVPRWTDDRVLHPDLSALGKAVRNGVFVEDGANVGW